MPQLNPGPWLIILLISWLTLLLILLPKILSHKNSNPPTPQNQDKLFLAPWNWPWL
uniref:ATP synthase complex subunit 8 n=1 Tax=Protopterus aethiopicus TaxID=7886 RepID=E3WCM7_PROAT|nr:ATP synthase F0 subunit 8 [Protopterus aethiopicus]BAJ40854.1 ATPase subunits 8 [Protopterus aethiopicus]